MRIRKRQVPFPLSSLSPIPLSDPHLSQSPVVQLQLNNNNPLQNLFQEDDTAAYFNNNQSSDQQNQPIGAATNHHQKEPKDCPVLLLQRDEKGGGEGERSNDTRRGNFLGAGKETMFVQESNSSHQALGRWCEGEKAFPLKKRRGNFERLEEETIRKEKKMKTKMNKKCLQENDNNQEQEEDQKNVVNGNATSGKKRVRGGALMEGSRCSRVNGRGWRCDQQTLVGYSLCEHHLGKGRLRSMNSVRSRSMASTATKKTISQTLSSEDKEQKHMLPDNKLDNGEEDQEEGDDDEKPLTNSRKKMKLGVVKARSISSLLGEANYGIAVVENNE